MAEVKGLSLEDAIIIYRKCIPEDDACETCPLKREVQWQVGDIGKLTISLCGLIQYLEDDLEQEVESDKRRV